LPEISIAIAEKVLRDIARRNGEAIRKRRSSTLKQIHGDGYAVMDPNLNVLLSGGRSPDGCDLSLNELAAWYRKDKANTSWQRIVIESILAGKI